MNRKKLFEAREKFGELAETISLKPYPKQKQQVKAQVQNALATLDAGLESKWRRWLRFNRG